MFSDCSNQNQNHFKLLLLSMHQAFCTLS
jgi:hypothetical protein